MVRPKINDVVEGIILGLLKQKMSDRNIVKQVGQMGHNVSVATVHRIKHDKGATRNSKRKTGKNETFTKRRTAATVAVVRKIPNMIELVNPPTQKEMAVKCGVSPSTVKRIIAKILKAKLRKKCCVHRLSEAQVLNRRA